MKTNTIFIVAAIASVLIASPYVFGLLTQNTLNSSGVMADIDLGVYSDSACTQSLSSINWGTCYVDENTTVMVYIKNLGTVASTLTVLTDNWTPTAAESCYLLYANCEGQTLSPNEVLLTTFTLYPLSTASQFTTFSFDVIIQAQD
jgi:archaellum component FlaG (FlaF/FlaG flagellin family)